MKKLVCVAAIFFCTCNLQCNDTDDVELGGTDRPDDVHEITLLTALREPPPAALRRPLLSRWARDLPPPHPIGDPRPLMETRWERIRPYLPSGEKVLGCLLVVSTVSIALVTLLSPPPES